ncbi:glycosyltransferase [Horticoccus luteus]|uniref:Glycosyltransferase n=1 Tax=Horticoccus luteus TaxID=2862869 RepID=A0A8F9TT08_9BACT|nr:glycosyltransferase [Horticoccus luteus]QYM77511.1 glycosyltransferase [Horticoccus luteus]
MKILQTISHYVPAYRFGGPLQVAHALGKELVKLGHEVIVCCTNQADEQSALNVPINTPVELDGIQVYYEPVQRGRRWGYSPPLGRRVEQLVLRSDVVIAHSHFQYAGWVGARAARRAGKPYLVYAHGSLKRDSLRASSGLAKRAYLALMENANLRGAKHVVFNAEEELDDSLYSQNGLVLNNGISADEFAVLPQRGGFRALNPELADRTLFLFLGRIDIQQKAVDLIVESFGQIVAACPEAMLLLAGPSEGGDVAVIETLIRRLGLQAHVRFLGLVSGTAKLDLLRDADVFLMPSRYEGLSIALLEAMASGLPVILSDRAGLHREVARHTCGIVVAPEKKAVTAAMLRLLGQEDRRRMGEAARTMVMRDYTWTVIAEQLEQVIYSCLTEN